MLYIFDVLKGSMMTFDMNLALQTVENLKKAIENRCQIPEEKQVLLISGGESLNPTSRVCSYSSSGTDTSPIFMFNKDSIDSKDSPQCVTEYHVDIDMKDRVQSCIDMDANYNTVVVRTSLAQQIADKAIELKGDSDHLVHDQHHQHQGWSAAVANLEDIVDSFKNTYNKLEEIFNQFIEEKGFYIEMIENFNEDINTLDIIPMLDNLWSNNSKTNDNESEGRDSITLLQWIRQKDSRSCLEQMVQNSTQQLEQNDSEQLSGIREEVEEVLKSCNHSEMKEIKGLGDRLFGLEKLKCDVDKYVEEQKDLAQAFLQNQARATNRPDPSIWPELCRSHQQQLQVMLNNHQQLRDIRRRCARAKDELSCNIHVRLRWIVFIEKKLSEVDSKVLIYTENIRRLKRSLDVIHQIHLAPKIYLSSVVEVVRRKTFSDAFLRWATDLAQQSSQLVQKEIELRQTFSSQLGTHFLQFLFPGMNDIPTHFANESPLPFDTDLPILTISDIEFLRQKLPDLYDLLYLPSPVPMPQPLDQNNSTVDGGSDPEEFETVNEDFNNKLDVSKHRNVFTEMSVNSLDIEELETNLKNISLELNEKSDQFKELEKNYENIKNKLNLRNNSFQSLMKVSFDSIKTLKDSKTSIIEQYSDFSNQYKSSFESMKQQLNDYFLLKQKELNEKQIEFNKSTEEYEKQISELNSCENSLKSEINSLKDIIENSNKNIESLNAVITDKNSEIECLKEDNSEKEKKLTLEHELELTSVSEELAKSNQSIQTLEDIISNKDLEINSMKQNYEKLESDLLVRFQEEKDLLKNAMNKDFNERQELMRNEFEMKIKEIETNNELTVCELRSQLEEEKKKALSELKDLLDSNHRHEIDSMRHRFKLAISTTSIERTPSESSLEKVNLDIIDQLAQEREVQKLKQLILDEKTRYEELLLKYKKQRDEELKQIKSQMAAKRQVSFNEALNKLSTEKEVLAQELKAKDISINSSLSVINECLSKYNSSEENEKTEEITKTLNKIENEINSLTDSFAQKLSESVVCEPKMQCICSSVNIIKEKELEISRLNRLLKDSEGTQTSAIGRIERISVLGCEVGDIVLIYYEEKYANYLVFHLNNVLHFLHTDCLESLSLKSASGEVRQQWTIGEVTDKEYCQAKRAENRYRVSLSTKFYRVKAKPWNRFISLMNRSMESRSNVNTIVDTLTSSASMTASNVSHMSTSVSPIEQPKSPDFK